MVKNKFPRNYRIFPELIKNISDEIIILAGLACLLIAILLIQADLYSNLQTKNRFDKEKAQVYNEISFWQKESQTYPDYRDAYLYLSILQYQIGNIEEARSSFIKAMEIDPNYEEKEKFEAVLK